MHVKWEYILFWEYSVGSHTTGRRVGIHKQFIVVQTITLTV